MIKRNTFFILLFLIATLLNAQSVDDYYHNSANLYINGKNKEAKQLLNEAISKFPNDENLKKLAGHIKDEENQQQQQQQQQQQKQQQQNEEQQQGQPKEVKISKEDAERMLEAIMKEEKETQKKVKEQQAQQVNTGIDKDW